MTALDISVARRATAAAQSILREADSSLQADGKAGSFTMSVYAKASSPVRQAADSVVAALGVTGGVAALNADYASRKSVAASTSDAASVFDLQVVPAIVRLARAAGMNPAFPIAQLALESTWGKHTPVAEDGSPSYNYGGIKWATVNTAKKAFAATKEFVSGKSVSTKDAFAVFDSPSDFAQAYITYITTSHRYPGLAQAKTAKEYGSILQKGGYATDPGYANTVASVAESAARKYALA